MDGEIDYETIKEIWLKEVAEEARAQNPLIGYCERVYFTSTSKGRRNGKIRRRKNGKEVELLRFLPSGRCVIVADLDTAGLDALAEEALTGRVAVSGDVNLSQLFLDYFRKL